MDYYILDIMGLKVPYYISIKKKLKYIRLAMEQGYLKVSLPYKMDICEVEKLLRRKGNWIFIHYKKYTELMDKCGTNRWDGKRALYRGMECNIIIHESDKKGCSAIFNKDKFELYVNRQLEGPARESALEGALKKLYIKLARSVIDSRLKHFAGIMGLSYNDVRVKDQKTRWGSCSGKGNLNFNWRLIMAPEEVLDYVIVHELSHLKHMNHSKEFWDMVVFYMPGYRSEQKWLKDNGGMLRIY